MNWKLYLSRPNKIQFLNLGLGKAFDTSFCVSFSIIKCIEAVFNYKISQGVSFINLKWLVDNGYLNANGQVSFSPRYLGTMADTTVYGNTQWNVINCIYAYGLIPETSCPNKADNWAEYADKDKITQEMKALGAEFIKMFDIDDIDTSELDNSPLNAFVRYAEGEGVLSPIGKTNHAISVYNEAETYLDISDNYWQEDKMYAKDKVFYLKGFTIKEKLMETEATKFIKANDLKWIRNEMTGAFGRIIHDTLMTLHSTDRAVLALLDDKVRNGGLSITNTLWDSLNKKEF